MLVCMRYHIVGEHPGKRRKDGLMQMLALVFCFLFENRPSVRGPQNMAQDWVFYGRDIKLVERNTQVSRSCFIS